MTNATLSINQLLGSGAVAKGKKIAAFNVGDALLGNPSSTADFQALLASLAKIQPNTVGKILASSTVEATTGPKAGTGILNETLVTPEFLAALKTLTPEQLDTLKLNAVIDPSELGATTLGILDALSSFTVDGEQLPEFFTVVDDPKLANALANLAAQVKALQVAVSNPSETANVPVAVVIQKPQATSLKSDVENAVVLDATDFESVLTELRSKPVDTLTISSADVKTESDGFDLLKKLAFADLAPFLTQPRVVRIDNRTVMKVAQGPSFLHDEGTDATAMTLLAGLVPVVAKAPEVTPVTPSADAPVASKTVAKSNAAVGILPAHLAALAAMQPKTNQPASSAPSTKAPTSDATQNIEAAVSNAASAAKPVVSTPLLVTVTPANAAPATQGIVQTAKGLENGLAEISEFDLSSAFDDALRVHADQTLPVNSSSSLISARSAGSSHPSTHLIALTMQRVAGDMPAGTLGERQFVIQLDPPNMGRLKITLDFIENNKIKARLLAERPETISLLQKDASVLERALQGSGFDASAPDSLSFDLGDTGDFSQGFGGGAGGHEGKGENKSDDGTDFATIENVMQVFVDPETGLTHINVVI
ncbi:MAG: flagellar hook-length control protein FliK [Proteobacteria bacterium]|nr:flagellar hook-length control protein FliK [Pseudomonadota bacterium]